MSLTLYEKEREERIRRNKEVLKQLDVPSIAPPLRPKPAPSANAAKKKRRPPSPPQPIRMSLRSRGPVSTDEAGGGPPAAEEAPPPRRRHEGTEKFDDLLIEYDEGNEETDEKGADATASDDGHETAAGNPLQGDDREAEQRKSESELEEEMQARYRTRHVERFLKSAGVDQLVGKEEPSLAKADNAFSNASELVDHLAQMAIDPLTSLLKVVPRRVYSLTAHPTRHCLLVLAGDNHGRMGIWRVDDARKAEEETDGSHAILQLEPHHSPITALCVPPDSQQCVYTCSHDGNIRQLDFERQVFETMYEDKDADAINDLRLLQPKVCLFATRSGYVAQVDLRARTMLVWEHQLHPTKIGSIAAHEASNVAVTAGNDGCVNVYDLRKISAKKPLATYTHARAVSSASLSPSGSRILTTSYDNTLRVYTAEGSSSWSSSIAAQVYRHDNNTGRWISVFKADWHPADNGVFICGSKTRPHGMDLFDYESKRTAVAARFVSEELSAVAPRHAFHTPSDSMLLGTSSGRVYVCRSANTAP